MGYCTYTVRPTDGLAVAAWIGTGTDAGKQKTVTYNYSGCPNSKVGQSSYQRCKDLRCADVRRQWCADFGVGAYCPSLGRKTCVGECCPPHTVDNTAIKGLIITMLEDNICHRNFSSTEIQGIAQALDKYGSIINSIRSALLSCNNSLALSYVRQAANAVRCAYKCDPLLFKGKCDSGCGGPACGSGPGPGPGPGGTGCVPCVGPIECMSNLGCNIGNFFRDAFQSGPDVITRILDNQNMMLIAFGVAALGMVFILKR